MAPTQASSLLYVQPSTFCPEGEIQYLEILAARKPLCSIEIKEHG